MSSSAAEMTLRDYAGVVRRRKWVVILTVLLVVLVAMALTVLQTPIYESSSAVLVQPRGQDGLYTSQDTYWDRDRAIQTEIQVIEGEAVQQRVQGNLALDDLPSSVSASQVGTTDVISLSVRDANAANAQTLANAYAEAYIEIRREQSVGELLSAVNEVQSAINGLEAELETMADDDGRRPSLVAQLASFNTTLDQLRVDAALRTGGASVIQTAFLPESPIEPTPVRTAMLAAIVGLLIGLGAAFLIDHLDDKIRREEDLEAVAGLPVLSVVPVDPPPDNLPIALSEPTHDAVESYRGLRTNLLFLGLDRAIRVIQVTSSLAAEGKTTTASNLAVVLAQAGHRVALVDADLRRPRLHEVFGIPQSPGFTDLLFGMDAKDLVHHIDVSGGNRLSVYPSGTVPSNPSEILSGRRISRLLVEMGGHYDYVVVDSAPILPVSDSVALAAAADGVLVVSHAGRVTQGNVEETLERLARVSAPVLGMVLNQASKVSREYYAYGGYAARQAPVLPTGTRTPTDDVVTTDA
jgi:polysaccharide biosynthesis transport protein